MATQAFSTFTNTGNDQRTVGGQGMVNLVSGQISIRTSQGTSESGFERSMLTIQLPEPSMALGLMAGVTALVGVSRRRIRSRDTRSGLPARLARGAPGAYGRSSA